MTNNLLKSNNDETNLIVKSTHTNTSQDPHIGINSWDSRITPSEGPPSNLGVLFDAICSLNDHVSKIGKTINYSLYSIGKIRQYIDTSTVKKMISCFITSRLDYCNSVLYGASGYLICQLQLCQNNAAQMLSLRRESDHITSVLKDLNWLPVEQRIKYKVLLPLINLFMHTSPSRCLCIHQTGDCDQRPRIFKMQFGRVWQTLFCACCSMALETSTYICKCASSTNAFKSSRDLPV